MLFSWRSETWLVVLVVPGKSKPLVCETGSWCLGGDVSGSGADSDSLSGSLYPPFRQQQLYSIAGIDLLTAKE